MTDGCNPVADDPYPGVRVCGQGDGSFGVGCLRSVALVPIIRLRGVGGPRVWVAWDCRRNSPSRASNSSRVYAKPGETSRSVIPLRAMLQAPAARFKLLTYHSVDRLNLNHTLSLTPLYICTCR